MELTRWHLQGLSALIARRSGMAFPEDRWPFLRCRARAVMDRGRRTAGASWMDTRGGATAIPDRLYADLEEALRVSETSFFRYGDHHHALRELVIPATRRDRTIGTRPSLRIWSVGCSTGEEPYSIAMTVQESLPCPTAVRLEILAVDVNRTALAAAQRGTYPAAKVAAIPPRYLAKYFRRQGDDFRVTPALREVVSFCRHDIHRGLYMGKFDAIFCCNVLLYCTVDAKRRLVEHLAASLRRGGFLFLGHADGITPPAEWFAPAPLPVGFVYQRV
jgi:chemotaxis protein methyltransferase CheR